MRLRTSITILVLLLVLVGGGLAAASGQGPFRLSTGDRRQSGSAAPPAQPPAPGVRFDDDFSNPSTGWPQTKDTYYEGGAYRVRVTKDHNVRAVGPRRADPIPAALAAPGVSVRAEVDAQASSGTGVGMGLYCRRQTDGADESRYQGVVFADGRWQIMRSTTVMTSGEAPFRGRGDVYRIALACSGDGSSATVRLEVGGAVVGQWVDSDGLRGGGFGVLTSTANAPNGEVVFDNFSAVSQ